MEIRADHHKGLSYSEIGRKYNIDRRTAKKYAQSDRGSQYTSDEVMTLLKKYGLRQSFSRVGTPGDNAWSESFFANLKKEAVHWVHFTTREEARQAMFAYIDGFYNTKRIQKRLGYFSPVQWLNNW